MKKKQQKKSHVPLHIFSEIYMVNFYISYGVPEQDFLEAWDFNLDGAERPSFLKCGYAAHIRRNREEIVWVWTRRKEVAVLAHEIMHAVYFTLTESIGMPLSDGNDEAYAYLMQMLMRKALGK